MMEPGFNSTAPVISRTRSSMVRIVRQIPLGDGSDEAPRDAYRPAISGIASRTSAFVRSLCGSQRNSRAPCLCGKVGAGGNGRGDPGSASPRVAVREGVAELQLTYARAGRAHILAPRSGFLGRKRMMRVVARTAAMLVVTASLVSISSFAGAQSQAGGLPAVSARVSALEGVAATLQTAVTTLVNQVTALQTYSAFLFGDVRDTPVFLPNGDRTTVLTLGPLPAGNYFVTAKVNIQNVESDAGWSCQLDQDDGTFIDATSQGTETGGLSSSHIALTGLTTLIAIEVGERG